MAIEKVGYKVLEKQGNFELRQYEPHIVAEIFVEGEFDSASNEGFRSLFNYISGNNRKKESIPMTAPVTQETGSEKIAMTSPVNRGKIKGEVANRLLDAIKIQHRHTARTPRSKGQT